MKDTAVDINTALLPVVKNFIWGKRYRFVTPEQFVSL